MKFFVFGLVVFMCFPCIVKVTPEPYPLIPSILSTSVIATTFPLLECVYIDLIIAYIAAWCKVLAVGNAVSTILGCMVAALPLPLGSLLEIAFNSLAIAFEEVGVPCYDTVSILSGHVNKKCPVLFPTLNTLFVKLAKEGTFKFIAKCVLSHTFSIHPTL